MRLKYEKRGSAQPDIHIASNGNDVDRAVQSPICIQRAL